MSEILWYIAGVIFIGVGIGFSIGWHELGHLIPAKLFGVKVPRYMIGFGPTLFSRKRGETEYGIKAIPLGGYITMIGMYPPAKPGVKQRKGFVGDSIMAARSAHSEFVTEADTNRMFYQLPVLKRIAVMFGGPFMNLLLGVVLTLVTLVGFGSYTRSTTIESIADCVPSSFTVNVACSVIDRVSPAKEAGLLPGDKVLSIDGHAVSNWDEIISYTTARGGQVSLVVVRGNTRQRISLTPVVVTRPVVSPDGSSVQQRVPFFGVVLKPQRQHQSVATALGTAGSTIAQTFNLIGTLPVQVYNSLSATIQGQHRTGSGAVSIVGVGQAAGEIASNQQASLSDKVSSGLMMLASLNFALFAFNMIPLLPLDGGHIAGGVYEAIKRGIWRLRRKPDPGPADTALLMPVTYVVSGVLLLLSVILILLDLINPVSF